MPLPLLLLLAALTGAAPPRSGAAAPMAAPGRPGLHARLDAPLRSLSELSESELERYAFLMLDPASSGGDTIPPGTVTRRITPKSVFIAPSINGDQCAEGYQQDEMGRCVKLVKVNAEKSWDLLLDKLNNQFGGDVVETLPEPTPPPGPLQVNIPIAGLLPEPDQPEQPDQPDQPEVLPPITPPPPTGSPVQENPTDVAPDAVSDEDTSTLPSTEDTTVVTERDVSVQLQDDESPAKNPSPFLLPEVVMLSSEEQFGLQASSESVGSHLVNSTPVDEEAVDANVTESEPLLIVAAPVNTSASDSDTNPIINTVNSSPLVTGDSLVQLLAPIVADASSLLPAIASSTERDAPSSSTTSTTTEAAISSSSTTEESSTAGNVFKHSTVDVNRLLTIPVVLRSSTQRTSTSTESTTPSTTTSTTMTAPPISSSSTTSTESPTEPKIKIDILRRPLVDSNASRFPLIVPPEVIRFPTEKPTLFRTSSGYVRFPSIDVTFPTSGSGGSLGGAAPGNKLLDRPVVFPKDDKQGNSWRLPPSAPASAWSLEQTRNRPLLYRYSWSRAPSTITSLPGLPSLPQPNRRDSESRADSSEDSSSSSSGFGGSSGSSGFSPSSAPGAPSSAQAQAQGNRWQLRAPSQPNYWKSPSQYNGGGRSTWHRRGREG